MANNTLTLDTVRRAMPSHLKTAATQALVDDLNNLSVDPEIADAIRDNFISYSGVLQEGKFRTDDYLNAVKYVSFKLMGDSNQDAYFKTFPQRYATLLAKGATPQMQAAYVSMYAKGKLVNLILEQSLVPTWVLNADIHQKAINELATLMTTARSEMVRATAANSILTHLKKPEATGPLINIDMREQSGINELKDTLSQLAKQQIALIEKGVTTKEIAAQKIVDASIVEPK